MPELAIVSKRSSDPVQPEQPQAVQVHTKVSTDGMDVFFRVNFFIQETSLQSQSAASLSLKVPE